MEDFSGCEECVGGVEVCAEDGTTDEGALNSNGQKVHREHDIDTDRLTQDPIARRMDYIRVDHVSGRSQRKLSTR